MDKKKSLKVSAGILFGMLIAAIINALIFKKEFTVAIFDEKMIFLFAGIILTLWLIYKNKRKDL